MMKFFAIGDGQRRVSLPDHYEYEMGHDGTAILWNPDLEVDIPIRVSVLTIEPRDKSDQEAAFWAVINKTNEKGVKAKVEDDRAIHQYREQGSVAQDEVLFFYEIGIGNALVVVSLTIGLEHEKSMEFIQVRQDAEEMIASIKVREKDHVFICELGGSDLDEIQECTNEIITGESGVDRWGSIQAAYDEVLNSKDLEKGSHVGLAFAEMIRQEIPTFEWKLTIDDFGCSRSLNFGDSGISIFPENMLLKRLEANEPHDLKQLASDTIDTVEKCFRENPPE